MSKNFFKLLCFSILLFFGCDSKTDDIKSLQKTSDNLLSFFKPSPEKEQENLEYNQLKKEVNDFSFPVLSEDNINKFNSLNNKIDNFIKKYPKSKKRLTILTEHKEILKNYLPVIKKYNELENAKTSQELEGIMYSWNLSESNPKDENVGKLMRNSKNIINQVYQKKAEVFEKERRAIVESINNPKPQNRTENNKKVSQKNLYFQSCKEARVKGYSGILKGQSGYSRKLDRDGDGLACE